MASCHRLKRMRTAHRVGNPESMDANAFSVLIRVREPRSITSAVWALYIQVAAGQCGCRMLADLPGVISPKSISG
jgi:hypothetical protein